ncbi:MAG: hypothetical protein ACWGNI_05685 [Desulfobacterales bacterium]
MLDIGTLLQVPQVRDGVIASFERIGNLWADIRIAALVVVVGRTITLFALVGVVIITVIALLL